MKNKIKKLDLDEGYIINRWLFQRFKKNKNMLIATVGATGSGKSYCNLRILELWYQYRWGIKPPMENVCFSIKEAMLLISSGNLRRGSILIVEEAGVTMNSLDFQNRLVKFFGFVLQSFRSKNIGILFNLPHLNFMTKTGRTLLHGIFQTMKIDTTSNEVIIKPFFAQINPLTGKMYKHYLKQNIDGRMVKIKRMHYKKPSPDIIEEYEKKKEEFVNKTAESLVEEIKKLEKKDEPKQGKSQTIKAGWDKEKVRELYNKGFNTPKSFAQAKTPHLLIGTLLNK